MSRGGAGWKSERDGGARTGLFGFGCIVCAVIGAQHEVPANEPADDTTSATLAKPASANDDINNIVDYRVGWWLRTGWWLRPRGGSGRARRSRRRSPPAFAAHPRTPPDTRTHARAQHQSCRQTKQIAGPWSRRCASPCIILILGSVVGDGRGDVRGRGGRSGGVRLVAESGGA